MGRMKCLWLFLGVVLFTVSIYDVSADVIPSENECRPYIEKAIHELKNIETTATETDNKESTEDATTGEDDDGSIEVTEQQQSVDDENSSEKTDEGDENSKQDDSGEEKPADDGDSQEQEQPAENANDSEEKPAEATNDDGDDSKEQVEDENKNSQEAASDDDGDSKEETGEEDGGDSKEVTDDDSSKQDDEKQEENGDDNDSKEEEAIDETQTEEQNDESSEPEQDQAQNESVEEENTAAEDVDGNSNEEEEKSVEDNEKETTEVDDGKDSGEAAADNTEEQKEDESVEEGSRAKRSIPDEAESATASIEQDGNESQENADDDNKSEETANDSQEPTASDDGDNSQEATAEESQEGASQENTDTANDSQEPDNESQEQDTANESQEQEANQDDESQEATTQESVEEEKEEEGGSDDDNDDDDNESNEEAAEEELTMEFEIPKNLRSRSHISDLLGLDAESSIKENALKRTGDVILKELKKIYDNAVKPMETLYKYRDLSNRHFGDPEMFSKPLVLFMGPWSGGKSTILNYLTDNEYTPNSIRSGAEPSPAYFNILMHGDEPEVMDGTQLAADWTFSGLQKFGEGLLDRLRGQRLPHKLLERVNIVEIPGILEVRKQVSRFFPFNDACQWFIDRADIIFLVYDPSKLDVGPETEAILDQLKGREYQTRILLNKADQVKPEELLRVQGALIWNISPLMSSAQPPVMYTVSLWSHPFEAGAPVRLLQAQERALLVDLREAIDKRIENKIASARRFAVRIRNHAKMVDCYLTTYYNQKGLFSNKKQISDKIIENPQNYNIYEGLSTLTNISRYDLPDPEVYLDFFRLNPLYEFKKLSETCTYFKGCPINKLDIAIAYDLPELVGKYKKLLEENFSLMRKEFDENCLNQSEPEPQVKIKSR